MLPEVDQAIVQIIQEKLDAVPKKDILIQRADTPPKRTPAIYVWNKSFTAGEISIGGDVSSFEKPVEEGFDGDGRKTSFKLSESPLRPVMGVEHPPARTIKEGRDYSVDYSNGILTFPTPPERGRKNVLIQYMPGKNAGEVKGMRLRLIYNIDVWASTPDEQTSLSGRIASILLGAQESLTSRGIRLNLTRGRDLTAKDGLPSGVLCKRLEYLAEANMMIKVPMTRMEKIAINDLNSPRRKSGDR